MVVQPTYVLNGAENERMIRDIRAQEGKFAHMVIGDPLLSSSEDLTCVAHAVAKRFPLREKEALVLMGHGAEPYTDTVYAALDYRFREMGFSNVYMGTVEGCPTVDSLLRRLEKAKPEKVILAPLMIVAGDHARNDLAGDGEDSWKTRFTQEGHQVECVLEGLGEYDEVRRVLLDHIDASARKLGESGVPLRKSHYDL